MSRESVALKTQYVPVIMLRIVGTTLFVAVDALLVVVTT
jgi:hypothetical protein